MSAQPIETAPRNGKVVFVADLRGCLKPSDKGTSAKAFWHEPGDGTLGMWAYPAFEGNAAVEQIDFEPTHWSHDGRDFAGED